MDATERVLETRTAWRVALTCGICGAGDCGERGWRLYLLDARETEALCPGCAERERGEDER